MSKKITIPQTIFLLWMILLLSSCSAGTVKPFLKDPDFQSTNLPIRTLRVLAMTDGTYTQPQISKTISECSQLIEQQVGLRLEIIDWKSMELNSSLPRDQILKRIANEGSGDKDRFDIAMAFTTVSLFGDGIPLALTGVIWFGVIDDTYRRYILVKMLDPYIILHELFHAFIFSEDHSMKCIMTTGFYPIGKNCVWLGIKDRDEVLKNKQRDFNVRPELKEGSDFIEEPLEGSSFEKEVVQRIY